jgi:hypothetical protein
MRPLSARAAAQGGKVRESRNPFRLRRAESIDTDAAFLILFEAGILEVLPAADDWATSVRLFRSAAGGGKTSLLRLFGPDSLTALHAHRSQENLKELYQRVYDLGALGDDGPKLLGVMLLCGRNYSILADLEIESARKDRLFYGLFNVRIVLATLRSALALRGLEHPKDLARIQVAGIPDLPPLPGLSLPCDGVALYKWAEKFEEEICSSLDSFGPLRSDKLPGHDAIHALAMLRPGVMRIDGAPVAERAVLMLDDVQKLTSRQRDLLIQSLIELRSPVGVWIAERFEALSTQEMLASGAAEGRDYQRPIELECYWRKYWQRFERVVLKIADRRVRAASDTEIDSFRPCLDDDTLDDPEWNDTYTRACQEIAERVRKRAGELARFRDWIADREKMEGTLRNRAIAWRTLEILIERELKNKNKGLFDDLETLNENDLAEQDDNAVQNAAELFLAFEYDLPYYYGAEKIARLGSLNIQQFLGLSGDLFEEITSSSLLKKTFSKNTIGLKPRRQHAILKAAAKALWDEIPRRVRYGRELQNLLGSIGRFSRWYTYRATAPNDPGVGGTAIRMSERSRLMDLDHLRRNPEMKRFADILASALAHNLLIADLDYNCKREKWMVLNLNRMLCVHFDLPLGYGLYKERPITELCRWVEHPYVAPTEEGSLL